MIERYTLPHMRSVWELGHKYEIWLEVELLACEALEQGGKIPRGVTARIRRNARIDPERIAAIEKVVKHDVVAFLESLAEPVGVDAFKLAIWYEEVRRHRDRLRAVRQDIAVGKLSGAMGTFAHLGPEVEEFVCARLGLKPDPISSQIVQRDRHAAYLSALALLAASIEKFATEVRHLQRTEVLEAEEYFSPGQKGSSAMPHKRNPIAAENLCGLARIVRANSLAALEDVALWHERDISHSSVERVVLPDSTILVDFMLVRLTEILKTLLVYPARMKQNLELTGGLIYSQRLLVALLEQGAQRTAAYEAVQRNAMEAWKGGAKFQELVAKDPLISRYLNASQIEACFDPKYYLRHLSRIYARVFADASGASGGKGRPAGEGGRQGRRAGRGEVKGRRKGG
ncbi:MAG: adenylosuccinate lyase [Nitrospirae bacterium]|nr:MAG: adenylosuccinate lyase [Nitrospirota bacterium]